MDLEEVLKKKTYYEKEIYGSVRYEQTEDESFYADDFLVPQIKKPIRVMRTGKARRLIDGPAAQIVTSNPQAYRRPLKENPTEVEADKRIVNYVNHIILPSMKMSNPNRFREFVKKQLLRGEGWIQTLHNSRWVENQGNDKDTVFDRNGSPLIFRITDPMITFASPEEDCNGVPEDIFLVYDRHFNTIQNVYPEWKNSKNRNEKKPFTKWWEYWDKNHRIFCVDDEIVFEGENPYGFVPFVHKVAGFGTESYDGKMEDFIVGRLRFSRDTLVRQCAMVSSMDYSIHTFANRSIDVQPVDDRHQIPDDFANKYEIGTGLIHELPAGIEVRRSVEELPEVQLFQYMRDIDIQLDLEDPLAGSLPIGGSGRQQDMSVSMALRKYDSVIENTEHAFATAIGQGLQMLDKVPKLRPDEIKKDDFRDNYELIVDLKASDPLENDRLATLGSRMLSQGEIDPITNLVDFKGYLREDAHKIMNRKLAWDVIFNDPDIRAFLGFKGIEAAGMADDLMEFKRNQTKPTPSTPSPSPTEQQRAAGETETQEGFNLIDQALAQRGQRTPPEAFERG